MLSRRYLILVVLLVLFCVPTLAAQEDPPELPASLAVIGEDYNVYVLPAGSDKRVALTDDAGDTRRYEWPTWAADNRLAYFCCSALTANPLDPFQVYVSANALDPGDLIYEEFGELFNYAYWSPGACASGENCRDLAVLLSTGSGMKVEIMRNADDDTTTFTTAFGGPPFYYSWSPDGQRMFWQRGNRSLDVYNAAEDTIETTLEDVPGFFQAPMWSPTDDRLLYAVSDTETLATDLIISENGETTVIQEGLEGLVAFAWSPDGTQIAARTVNNDGFGRVGVIDAATGEVVTSTPTEDVFAFFWSPDSSKIAYLTPSQGSDSSGIQPANVPDMAWSVLDVASDTNNRYAPFTPTGEFLYFVTYFDQFAQSHRLWSPDSVYLTYGETRQDEGVTVSILDTSRADAVPFAATTGTIGIWSYR